MFSGNGANVNSGVDDAINIGNGFDPHLLTTTPDALGNFVGTAGFVSPRDPRPIGDGPANFFLDANFDLTLGSSAIDNAIETLAPKLDFLSRGRVDIANKGFTGRGPADVGAFEYNGVGGTTTSTTTGTTGSGGTGGGFKPLSVSADQGTSTTAASSSTTTAPSSTITPQAADAVFNDPTTSTDTTPSLDTTPTVVVTTPATSTVTAPLTPAARLAARLAARRQALMAARAAKHPTPHQAAYLGSRFRKG
jgi:hypothetical protein